MTTPDRPLRLGTRASPLAMAQAHMVRNALLSAYGWVEDRVEIIPFTASGDRILDRALAEVGGKALWTKELDRALADGVIDFSVHSMKDVETLRPPEISLVAMLPRADVRDRLIGAENLAALKPGAVVGTSAPRRTAQVLRARPDVKVVLFRGNVATRLAKLEAGEADATLLAAAGLLRLGMENTGHDVAINDMLPAPAQGAVGVETLAGNDRVQHLLSAISHADTFDCVMAERALLAGLGAGCHSPVAALAVADGQDLWLRAEIMQADGSETISGDVRLKRGDTAAPAAFARTLLDRASPALHTLFE